MYIELTNHWTNNPAIGVLNGQSLAKNDDHGRIPSRPSSWMTLPWTNAVDKVFPKVDTAIMRLSSCEHRSSVARTGNISTTYPFCTRTEHISEEERAGITGYLNISMQVKTGLELTQWCDRCPGYRSLRPRQSMRC